MQSHVLFLLLLLLLLRCRSCLWPKCRSPRGTPLAACCVASCARYARHSSVGIALLCSCRRRWHRCIERNGGSRQPAAPRTQSSHSERRGRARWRYLGRSRLFAHSTHRYLWYLWCGTSAHYLLAVVVSFCRPNTFAHPATGFACYLGSDCDTCCYLCVHLRLPAPLQAVAKAHAGISCAYAIRARHAAPSDCDAAVGIRSHQ